MSLATGCDKGQFHEAIETLLGRIICILTFFRRQRRFNDEARGIDVLRNEIVYD